MTPGELPFDLCVCAMVYAQTHKVKQMNVTFKKNYPYPYPRGPEAVYSMRGSPKCHYKEEQSTSLLPDGLGRLTSRIFISVLPQRQQTLDWTWVKAALCDLASFPRQLSCPRSTEKVMGKASRGCSKHVWTQRFSAEVKALPTPFPSPPFTPSVIPSSAGAGPLPLSVRPILLCIKII